MYAMYNSKMLSTVIILAYIVTSINTAKADEWSNGYKTLFGIDSRIKTKDSAKQVLDKLSRIESDGPQDQKALVDAWIRAGGQIDRSMCTSSFVDSLKMPADSCFGLRAYLREVKERLFGYCMDEFLPSLHYWYYDDQQLIDFFTDGVKFNEDVPLDYAVDRLVRRLDRDVDLLRHNVFNLGLRPDRIERNFERFKVHYSHNSPCTQQPLKNLLENNPNFLTYFTHPEVVKKLNYGQKDLFRRVLACKQFNEFELAQRKAFEMIFAKAEYPPLYRSLHLSGSVVQ